jgi:type II secretory pathway predicted ATPase ExeA
VSGIYDAIIDDVSEGFERPKRSLEYKARQARRLLEEARKSNDTQHVLLIEEAQALTVQTLKSLKRFWELKLGFDNLLGIVLIGQTELRRHLKEDAWQTREVALRCQQLELKPLTITEIEAYLTLKFKRVQVRVEQWFDEDVYTALHARLQADGVSFAYPQRINNLVTQVLNKFAEVGGFATVSSDLVLGDLRLRGEL